MNGDLDQQLAALLAAPEREPDEAFALRMRQIVLTDERLRAAQRRAWRKFAFEMAGGAAALLTFILLNSLQAPGPEGRELPFFSPAMMGVLLLGLWAAVTLRPGAAERR
jgi:hypothetical protein